MEPTTTVVIMDSSTAKVYVRSFIITDDLEERIQKFAELEDLSWSDCEYMTNVESIDIQTSAF